MKDMENELRKAYDSISLDQLREEMDKVEVEPLSKDREDRIKEIVKEKMKKEQIETTRKTSRKTTKWAVAAAAVVFAFAGIAFMKADKVQAELSQLFGFIPGVGVVEMEREDSTGAESSESEAGATETDKEGKDTNVVKAAKWYLLENVDDTVSNDMIQIELKDAVANGEELELRYAVRLVKISDENLEAAFEALTEDDSDVFDKLYSDLGYKEYFDIEPGAQILTPISSTTINGAKVEPVSVNVGGSETTEGARTVCVSEVYYIKDLPEDVVPSGTLDIAGVSIDFKMKKLELGGSMEDVTRGAYVDEVNGVKVMCIPNWKEDRLHVDFYALETGAYETILGFNLFGPNGCVATIGGKALEEVGDETYIFNNEGSNYIGRRSFDVSKEKGETASALVRTHGLWVKQAYEGKKIELTEAPATEQALGETFELDGCTVEVAQMSNVPFESEEEFDYSEHGYLVIKYKADSASEKKMFTYFASLCINGEKVDDFYIEDEDGFYRNMWIPLPMPYSEIRTIEFMSAYYQLDGDMQFEIKK